MRIQFQQSLRVRLITYFLLFLLLPALIIGAGAYVQVRLSLQEAVIQQLDTAATLNQNAITRWIDENTRVALILADNSIWQDELSAFLNTPEPSEDIEIRLQDYLADAKRHLPDVLEIWVLDRRGQVVLSSNLTRLGNFHVTDTFFIEGRQETFVQNLYFLPAFAQTTITIATPLSNGDAVLSVHLDATHLDQILFSDVGLGDTGEIYLIDNLNGFVSQARGDASAFPRGVHTEGINLALQQQDGSGFYNNYEGTPVIGVYRWLADYEMALIAEVSQSEAVQTLNNLTFVMAVIIVLVVAVIMALSYPAAQHIVTPILHMVETATAMAKGDLSQRVTVASKDEIGLLANTFNSMADQLQTVITDFEERVARRTARLESVPRLTERLNAILNLEELLAQTVNLIYEQLGYYHTHIYLLDDERENLQIVAGTGEAGAALMEQHHTIPVSAPTSLVAKAARNKQFVLVSDVRADPDWLPNELLPDTHAEVAVPIVLENLVVGVLDVQEDQVNGVDESDAALLRSIANQVAVAIRNARLFAEVEQALREAQNAQSLYTQHSWRRLRRHRVKGQAEVVLDSSPADQSSQQTPIVLREQEIGTVDLLSEHDKLPEDEQVILDNVVVQMSQIAENLRLFDETRQRASRERTIREITEKLRTAPNLEQLLVTATEELSRRLSASHVKLNLSGLNTRSPK